MHKSLAIVSALAMGAFFLAGGSARAADLTGKMAAYSYLISAPWNCTTNVPAMANMPAHTDQGTATFDVVPGNVMHNHISTPMYSGDSYFGYYDRMSSYWEVDADSMGGHAFLTSSDGKTYSGTSSMGPMSMQETTTYSKVADNKATVHQVLTVQGQAVTIDSVCTR